MEGQVTDVEQEVIITNNNLLFHFSGHNNDLLVLKQWKGAAPKKASELRHYPIYIFSFFLLKVKSISPFF